MLLDPNPPLFPDRWASSWGEDSYGLWQAFEIKTVRQIMRWILPGQFDMGSPKDEAERHSDETLHRVRISRGFWLAETACTQALWQQVMNDNPSEFKSNPNNPVEQVSWHDCQQFIDKLNQSLGGYLTLRFPTEAEWEYACRAGTKTAFNTGVNITTDQANYDGNYPYPGSSKGDYRQCTIEVDAFSPNPWGLYQMHGNVWEWCADLYGDYSEEMVMDPQGADQALDGGDDQRRVLRGGSWINEAHVLRSAYRVHNHPDNRYNLTGLRLAACG